MKLWMLPEGMEESLPEQAWRVEGLRRQLLDHYRAKGYALILPPLVEHLDALLTGSAAGMDGVTFKLTDPASGRLLGIRSDMTPQAARMAARHFASEPIVRLCYLGTVLRTQPDALGAARAPRQVGCELFGETTLAGDLEALGLMLDTLSIAGLSNVHLDLGHVGVYRAVIQSLGLEAAYEAELFDLLQRKSKPEIAGFAASAGLSPGAQQALECLISLNGDVGVLRRARAELAPLGTAIAEALDSLEAVVSALAASHPDIPLHLDLAELRGASYHTGLTFAAFVPGHGRDLARGGRYDGVGQEFGMSRPATGFSADMNDLLRLSA